MTDHEAKTLELARDAAVASERYRVAAGELDAAKRITKAASLAEDVARNETSKAYDALWNHVAAQPTGEA